MTWPRGGGPGAPLAVALVFDLCFWTLLPLWVGVCDHICRLCSIFLARVCHLGASCCSLELSIWLMLGEKCFLKRDAVLVLIPST